MTTTMQKIVPATLLAALMLLSAVGWSGEHPRGGEGPRPDDGRMLMRMVGDLDLSDEQKSQLKTLLKESRDAGSEDMERARELQESLRAMRADFDAAKARTLATELGEVSGRMAYRKAEVGAKVYAVLTPEQRAEMDAQAEKRSERKGGKPPRPAAPDAE